MLSHDDPEALKKRAFELRSIARSVGDAKAVAILEEVARELLEKANHLLSIKKRP